MQTMKTNQCTIATEQTIVFDGGIGVEPKPFLLKLLTPLTAKPDCESASTGTWSTGPDDGSDYMDT